MPSLLNRQHLYNKHLKKNKQLLNFATTQGNTTITYKASNMVLAVHSNASYLSTLKARSKAETHFFYQQMKNPPTAMALSTT